MNCEALEVEGMRRDYECKPNIWKSRRIGGREGEGEGDFTPL